MEGEAVDLQAGDLTFLGIDTESSGGGDPPKGAAILVHGIGVHPDWPQVIHPLRVGLPERGGAPSPSRCRCRPTRPSRRTICLCWTGWRPAWMRPSTSWSKRDAGPIVIIAHSLGATMAGDYLASHPGAVAAYVAIGMSGAAPEARLDNVQTVGRIKLPTLDIYGQNDLEAVVGTAPARVSRRSVGGTRATTRYRYRVRTISSRARMGPCWTR